MSNYTTENFEKTLNQLKNYLSIPINNDRDKAGIIQAFEFTFEQSWLSIQKVIGKYEVKTPTPKQAFAAAMKQGWISTNDELIWLEMIDDRNKTSNTYRQALAEEVLGRVLSQYVRVFESLLQNLKQ
jgi:nucleotidyltransferase substrate binding protein (TIGR01987 family)